MSPRLFDLETEHDRGACILGAGSAGLSCAYVLKQNGLKISVLEKQDAVGGDAQTIQEDGFSFDLGGHVLATRDPVVERFFKTIMGEDLLQVSNRKHCLHRGKYLPYPPEWTMAMSSSGPVTGGRVLFSYLWAKASRQSARQSETLQDWLSRHFGRKLSQLLFEPYCEKVWGDPARLVTPDFDCLGVRDPDARVEHCFYPPGGIGEFSRRLGESVGADQIWTGSEVTRIAIKNQKVAFVECGQPPFKHRLSAGHYVSGIPLTRLVWLLDPPAPSAVQNAAHRLENRNLVAALLRVKGQSFGDHVWTRIPDRQVRVLGMHEPRNLSPRMAPDGMTSLVLEYPCSGGDDIWSAPENRNQRRAVHELTNKLGLLQEDQIESVHIRRLEDAFPSAKTGYQELRQCMLDYLATISNLHLVGRTGRYRYGNFGHGIEMGLKAALNVLGADFDLESVNAPLSDRQRYPYDPAADRQWLDSEQTLFCSPSGQRTTAAASAVK